MKFNNELVNQLVMSGYTLPEVAKKINLPYEKLVFKYKPIKKKNKYIQYLNLWEDVASRNKNNFDKVLKKKILGNEMYSFSELSPNDLEAYYKYEEKHKAYYEI